MLACIALCTFTVAPYRVQFPLPDLKVPSGWGVNIHFNDPRPGEMEKISAGGFRWIRQDLSWGGVEREKGKYDFEPLARLFAACKKNGVRPLIILDYGNDLYQDGSPTTPASRKAFANMVEALMNRFKGQGAIWEMWNEPNISFWKPKPNVVEYIALATEVGKTIRRVAPQEWYIGPATSGFDWSFLDKCLKSGLLKYWDAVSVHPYRNNEPESVSTDWARLRSMIDRNKPAGKTVPMISGEWGYSEKYSGLSLELQSKYIARQYLANLMAGVGLSIWYDWKDDGTDPKEPEHHFGSVYGDLSLKPTFVNKKSLADELVGYTYHMRLALASPDSYLLAFRKGSSLRYVAWTTSKTPSSVTIPGLGRVQVNDLPKVLTAPDGPAKNLVLAWSALPPSISVASKADADAVTRSIAVARPKNAKLIVPTIKNPLLGQPQTLQARLTGGGVTIAQETIVSSSRPLNARIIPRDKGIAVEVENLSERNFVGDVVVTPGGTSRLTMGTKIAKTAIEFPKVDATKPFSVTLRESNGDEATVFEGVWIQRLPGFQEKDQYALVDDGDPKLKGTYTVTTGDEFRVDYVFPVGWKFFTIQPRGALAKPLPGKPAQLGMMAWGDGSGDLLLMRYSDSTGQTFQHPYGPLDWKGWRYVTFNLDGTGGRWGGANDGIVHYPIHLDSVAVVDALNKGTHGKFAVKEIALLLKR